MKRFFILPILVLNRKTIMLILPFLRRPTKNRPVPANGETGVVVNGKSTDGANALIHLNNVDKAYETPAGKFVALKHINLDIDRGEFVAVVGKSGSGKSTLINMITGIDRPSSGGIIIDGTPIHKLEEGPMAVWRGKTIGVIFQFFQLLPMLTCAENVMLPMDFCNMYKPNERRDRALYLLEQVDMADQADKLPSEVSGGQQQRAAIARALANDPPLLVADEPTGNLDTKTADAVFQLFQRQIDQGKTIVMVTHDVELAKRVTRTVTIADGEIVGDGLHEVVMEGTAEFVEKDALVAADGN
jgi:putative ABC transport system ATP-binding protein